MNKMTIGFRNVFVMALLVVGENLFAQAPNSSSTKINSTMKIIQTNTEIVTELYHEILNNRALDRLGEVIDAQYTGASNVRGVEGFRIPVLTVLKAMPDAKWTIQNLIGDGSNVFVHWKINGTNTGMFQTFLPTGKTMTSEGMGVFKIEDGKIVSSQVMTDRLGFLQQLGVLPFDLSTLSSKALSSENVIFIDKFLVPASAMGEFMDRVNINRKMISTMTGFVEDQAYERKDESGNVILITVAVWQNAQALQAAKTDVQERYKQEGFDPAAFMQRLHIVMDRGTYEVSGL